LLLLGGHTAHSRFKIPCDELDNTTCNIKCGPMFCELIQVASLIIWDEALMTHRMTFEALDMTLHDIVLAPSSLYSKLPFGGKVVVLGGDLRQTLLVVHGGSHAEITCSAIVDSPLWLHVTVLQLTLNMQLSSHGLTEESKKELAEFSKWKLGIGEGNIYAIAKQDETEGSWIQIPDELLLKTHDDKVACMVDIVYPQLGSKYMDIDYLRERAILTLTDDIADKIKEYIVSSIPGEEKQYLSSDTILKAPNTHDS
jgi:ATP-dependent DNA helicase PIF1